MDDLIERESVIDVLSKASIGGSITDRINAIHAVNRWIPCNERMPEPNETVLYVWRSKYGNVSVLHGWHFENLVENAWHQSGIGMSRPNEEVTHWMPLPEPPESEVQEDA